MSVAAILSPIAARAAEATRQQQEAGIPELARQYWALEREANASPDVSDEMAEALEAVMRKIIEIPARSVEDIAIKLLIGLGDIEPHCGDWWSDLSYEDAVADPYAGGGLLLSAFVDARRMAGLGKERCGS